MVGRSAAGQLVPAPGADSRTDDTVRAEERRRLARELYDIVAHHLANVALRTMGRPPAADLEHVLADVHAAAGHALVELRLLSHVLGDDPEALTPVDGVDELTSRLVPSAAAARWQRRLREHGRTAEQQVPPAADLLPLSVQSTLARTFAATGDVVLAHTGEDARCTLTVEVATTEVRVRTTTTLPPAPQDPQQGHGPQQERDLEQELGRGLRGLRQRVDLSHGRLHAAVHGGADRPREWVVTVALPLG